MRNSILVFAFSLGLLVATSAEEKTQPKTKPVEPPPSASLSVEGTAGLKFMGICVSADSPREKKFEGTIPAEVDLDLAFQKCSVKTEEKSGKMVVRLFHNRRLVNQNQTDAPFAGIEFSLPIGKTKKK